MAAKAKTTAAEPENMVGKRVINGVVGFALMRLAKKSGVYAMYKELVKKAHNGDMEDAEAVGIELMVGISERLADCEKEFWETAAALYGQSIDEVQSFPFDEVRSAVVSELMDPGMIAFFTKAQAGSGK